MNVLVTGGAGFIGFHVARALISRGDTVVLVDNLNDYYDVSLKKARLEQLGEGVKFYQLDLGDFSALRQVFADNKIDKVLNLAAQAGVRYSIENPFAYQRTNSLGFLNLLELMREFRVRDLVFASSSSVYGGNTKVPFAVDDNVDGPVSLYAATKKANELYAHAYHKLYGLNCWGLRFFTVYGPFGRPDMAYFKFTKKILAGEPIEVYNHGDHERDFTYIDDVVPGVLLALDRVNGYDVWNLGNNAVVGLMYFISLFEKELGLVATKEMLPMQKGDVHRTFADIEHTKEVLGWAPQTSVEEGVHKFVTWYKEYYKVA